MRLGIDLDGVVYDFVADCADVFAEHLGVSVEDLAPVTCWDFPVHDWGVAEEDFWPVVFQGMREGKVWWERPPVEGAVEGLTRLRDAGHRLVIATSRGGAEEATISWIKKFDVPYDSICITKKKTDVAVDLFVDDFERNHDELWGAGTPCALFDQIWNRHVSAPLRVYGWDGFERLVEYVGNGIVNLDKVGPGRPEVTVS